MFGEPFKKFTLINNDGLRKQLEQDPAALQRVIDHLMTTSGVRMPKDYDVESAFADVLSLGIQHTDPETQQPILRLAFWLFERLPKGPPEVSCPACSGRGHFTCDDTQCDESWHHNDCNAGPCELCNGNKVVTPAIAAGFQP